MKHSRFLLVFLCALLLAVSVPGVFALWTYFDPPEPVEEELSASLSEWEYVKYTIIYVYLKSDNTEAILASIPVEDNSKAVSTVNADAAAAAVRLAGAGYSFSHWMNAGSTMVESVPAGNKEDVKLYPSFSGAYTATFVSQAGEGLGSILFTPDNNGKATVQQKANSITAPVIEDCIFAYWQVQIITGSTTTKTPLDEFTFNTSNIKGDITVYPVYTYNGDVNLIPVDENADGEVDYYLVGGYKNDKGVDVVEIPGEYNGKKVTAINADAFASYPDLHCVTIPVDVKNMGDYTFAEDWSWSGDSGETQTLYYEGSYQDWLNEMTYSQRAFNGLSTNTRIFFLNGGDKVDPSQGYLQVQKKNVGKWYSPDYVGELVYHDPSSIDQNFINGMYTEKCNCGKVDHTKVNETGDNRRPDYVYWGNADGSGAIKAS